MDPYGRCIHCGLMKENHNDAILNRLGRYCPGYETEENDMADKKKATKSVMVQGIMDEARAEVLKENRSIWVKEVKAKMATLTNAKKIVANCEREIEDLELRISQELV